MQTTDKHYITKTSFICNINQNTHDLPTNNYRKLFMWTALKTIINRILKYLNYLNKFLRNNFCFTANTVQTLHNSCQRLISKTNTPKKYIFRLSTLTTISFPNTTFSRKQVFGLFSTNKSICFTFESHFLNFLTNCTVGNFRQFLTHLQKNSQINMRDREISMKL